MRLFAHVVRGIGALVIAVGAFLLLDAVTGVGVLGTVAVVVIATVAFVTLQKGYR